MVKNDYLEKLSPDEKQFFSDENGDEPVVFAIVTIPHGRVEEMTANLLGPIIIEVKSRTGRQVILNQSGYNHRHPLIATWTGHFPIKTTSKIIQDKIIIIVPIEWSIHLLVKLLNGRVVKWFTNPPIHQSTIQLFHYLTI